MVGNFTQGINSLELVSLISKKNRVQQRVMLNALEEILGKGDEFQACRKIILDNTNDFTRTIVKEIFGDEFEGELK